MYSWKIKCVTFIADRYTSLRSCLITTKPKLDLETKMLYYSNPKPVSENHESWSEAGFSWNKDGGMC